MGKLHIKNECHKSRDCIKLLSKKGTDSVAHRSMLDPEKGILIYNRTSGKWQIPKMK